MSIRQSSYPMKQEKLTVEQFRALAEKQKSGTGKKKSKYHAEKCNGYDSKKEYYHAQQLKLLLKAGLISNLREQVVFLLIPSQTNGEGIEEHQHRDGVADDGAQAEVGEEQGEGIEERPVKYKADFVYIDNATGQTVVEDTKGFRTPEYIIKRKLMLQVHGITIKEV